MAARDVEGAIAGRTREDRDMSTAAPVGPRGLLQEKFAAVRRDSGCLLYGGNGIEEGIRSLQQRDARVLRRVLSTLRIAGLELPVAVPTSDPPPQVLNANLQQTPARGARLSEVGRHHGASCHHPVLPCRASRPSIPSHREIG